MSDFIEIVFSFSVCVCVCEREREWRVFERIEKRREREREREGSFVCFLYRSEKRIEWIENDDWIYIRYFYMSF